MSEEKRKAGPARRERTEERERGGSSPEAPTLGAPAARNALDRNLVALTDPDSVAAEQYRLLFHRIERSEVPVRALALTSALPGEGKSLTSANLALVAASELPGGRVLLIDADLRRPRLHQLFGLEGGARSAPGLSEVLAGTASIESALQRVGASGPFLLTAGQGAPGETARPGIRREALHPLLADLRQRFDALYLDAPPLLSVADGALVASESDAVLLVVRAGETSRQRVAQAIEALGDARLLGCVLNGVEAHELPYRP